MELAYQPGQVIFEAGSSVTVGSTPYLREVAALHGVPFINADIVLTGDDAVEFVSSRWPGGSVRFAYLDSFDWPYENMNPGELQRCIAKYAERGVELTKDASAAHHADLARVIPWADDAVVVFDDTWPAGDGVYDGKGRDAVPWLLSHGWEVLTAYAEHVDNTSYVALRRVA